MTYFERFLELIRKNFDIKQDMRNKKEMNMKLKEDLKLVEHERQRTLDRLKELEKLVQDRDVEDRAMRQELSQRPSPPASLEQTRSQNPLSPPGSRPGPLAPRPLPWSPLIRH